MLYKAFNQTTDTLQNANLSSSSFFMAPFYTNQKQSPPHLGCVEVDEGHFPFQFQLEQISQLPLAITTTKDTATTITTTTTTTKTTP